MKIDDILFESVSFFVNNDEDDNSENYKDLLSLSHYMSNLLYYKHVKPDTFLYKFFRKNADENGNIRWWRFDPDGDDHFEKTGVINVYLPEKFISDKLWPTFEKHLYDMLKTLDKGVEIGELKIEGKWSNRGDWKEKDSWENRERLPYTKGEPVSNIGVIRIPVIKNEVSIEEKPEMNIANSNAASLLRVLGFNSEGLVGTIRHQDIPRLLMRIRNLSQETINQGERQPETSQKTRIGDINGQRGIVKGPLVMDVGLDISRIKVYLSRLTEILEYAHRKGKDVHYG